MQLISQRSLARTEVLRRLQIMVQRSSLIGCVVPIVHRQVDSINWYNEAFVKSVWTESQKMYILGWIQICGTIQDSSGPCIPSLGATGRRALWITSWDIVLRTQTWRRDDWDPCVPWMFATLHAAWWVCQPGYPEVRAGMRGLRALTSELNWNDYWEKMRKMRYKFKKPGVVTDRKLI